LKRLKQKFQLDLGMLPDTVNSRLGVTQLDKMAFVLDFAGSTTTTDAVLQYNAEDGGNRQFVRVQLPEPNNEKSEAFMGWTRNHR
jgi:adenine-specific DNA-methyltransferase